MKVEQIKKMGVIGAGTMGHGIAQAYAQAGYAVAITDAAPQALAGVKDRIRSNLETIARGGLLASGEIEPVLDRITVVDNLAETVCGADFVTEAVIEDVDLKTDIFQEMEKHCQPETILASNTSSFPMTRISSRMKNPERAIITHWSNPPYLIPLVEVVLGEKTAEDTFDATYRLLEQVKKVPVRLQKEVTGFIMNRIQTAMNREVYHLLEMGVASAEDIDRAVVTSIGFRLATLGPLVIRDLAGLDVTCKVDETLLTEINSSPQVNRLLKEMVERGDLGAKTGKGFFTYTPESLAELIRERDQKFIERVKQDYLSPE